MSFPLFQVLCFLRFLYTAYPRVLPNTLAMVWEGYISWDTASLDLETTSVRGAWQFADLTQWTFSITWPGCVATSFSVLLSKRITTPNFHSCATDIQSRHIIPSKLRWSWELSHSFSLWGHKNYLTMKCSPLDLEVSLKKMLLRTVCMLSWKLWIQSFKKCCQWQTHSLEILQTHVCLIHMFCFQISGGSDVWCGLVMDPNPLLQEQRWHLLWYSNKQMFKDMFCFDISDNKSNVLMFYKYFMRVLKASCLLHNPNSRQFNLRTCVYS